MASNSGETSSEPICDLATLICQGKVNKEVLQLYAEKGQIDIPDKDGKTPLMYACLKSLEEPVKFLLANGANPNSKCFKEGNTPMHYACMVEEKKEDFKSLSEIFYNPFKWMTFKIAIIKLLLGSGALAVQDNLNHNGWSPPCVAALYMLKDVVDFFLAMDDIEIPLELKIKATEILGVSQATLDHHFDCKDAFHSFSRAISFQQGASLPKAQSETSELAACFSKVSLQECHTEEEFESIRQSEVALKAHAFLVGDRLFPQSLKQRYLYPALTSFACDLMWEVNMFEEGLQVLKGALGFEHQGELKLGSVVSNLAEKCASFEFKQEEPNHQYLQCIRDLLCEYESILNNVHIDSLSDNSDSLMESFGKILFNEAFYCSTVDILKSTLQAIEKLVRVIRGRIRKENPDKYHELSSVTFKVMTLLIAEAEHPDFVVDFRSLRVRFIISKILFSESASCKDIRGNTLLHLVAQYMHHLKYLKPLEDLARAFVSHGCPIDVVNNLGKTARDILEANDPYDKAKHPLLLRLVSPPTTVLRLEEIAIRAISRHKISYLDKLPPSLCVMIEGGVKDSDLV